MNAYNKGFSMRAPIRYVIICLFLAFFSARAGSYFASQYNGMGIRQYSTTVRGVGMGMTGIAALDSLSLANYGISQWRYIQATRISVGVFYQRINLAPQGEQLTSTVAGLSGINIAIPLSQRRWVMGINLQPYSRIDFKATETITSNGQTFTQNSLSTGNIAKAQLNLAWSPSTAFGFSVNGNFYFGSIEDQYEFDFPDNNFNDISHALKYTITGPGIGFSADYRPLDWLTLAGFVDLKSFPLKVKTAYDSQIALADTVQKRNLETFPLQFGVGSALRLGSRWNLALDYAYQKWSATLQEPAPNYEDWFHFGIGFERELLMKYNAGFFDRMDYRAGFSATRLGYKFNQESAMEYGIHLGLGIPFGDYRNRLDFAISGGLRGSESKNLAEEKFVNFRVEVNIGERWFQSGR